MLTLLILSTVIVTAVSAHPQRGSLGVLGWCVSKNACPSPRTQCFVTRKANPFITVIGHFNPTMC